MEPARARDLFAAARVAVLSTLGPDGAPHAVPVTFAVVAPGAAGGPAGSVVTAVDGKPKRTANLRRLDNLRADPRASLLVQHWDEDWSRLWWVRADGTAGIGEDPAALALLAARYAQYQDTPLGPVVITLRVRRWSGWSAS